MSECEHSFKRRLYGKPGEKQEYKLLCYDCLKLLETKTVDAKAANKPSAITDENRLSINEFMEQIDANKLSEWEQTFHESLYERWEKYKEGTRISEKQQGVIDRMQAKYLPDAKPALDLSKAGGPVGQDNWKPGDDGLPF